MRNNIQPPFYNHGLTLWRGLAPAFLASLFFLAGCAAPPPEPESVLEEYLELVYQGKIEQAQQYCTPAGRQHLEVLRGVMFSSESQPDSSGISILALNCEVKGDTAHCYTRIDDGFAKISGQYWLILSGENNWLVDQRPLDGRVERSTESPPTGQ